MTFSYSVVLPLSRSKAAIVNLWLESRNFKFEALISESYRISLLYGAADVAFTEAPRDAISYIFFSTWKCSETIKITGSKNMAEYIFWYTDRRFNSCKDLALLFSATSLFWEYEIPTIIPPITHPHIVRPTLSIEIMLWAT